MCAYAREGRTGARIGPDLRLHNDGIGTIGYTPCDGRWVTEEMANDDGEGGAGKCGYSAVPTTSF